MILIEAQGPRTVALGILLSFYLDFILVLPYFRFRSVRYCPNYRQVLEKQVKRRERLSAAPVLLALHRKRQQRCDAPCAYRRSGAHFLCHQAKRGAFAAPILRFQRIFHIRGASPISRVRIVVLIVLAQHKRNERIGEARTPVSRASPIVIELAYKFCCTDQKQKYVQYKTTTNSKFKIMPSATVPGQYPTIGTILDPPQFLLDTTFNMYMCIFKPHESAWLTCMPRFWWPSCWTGGGWMASTIILLSKLHTLCAFEQ